MALSRTTLVTAFLGYAAKLRFRQLFFIAGGLFLLDLLVPDLIPFADEILLGLLTLLFGAWKKGADALPSSSGEPAATDSDQAFRPGQQTNDKAARKRPG
jgi:hypothetical protein